ncbi:putative Cytochrome P450 [Melia azedarach]|uniref:Cytochrome P450 n=1 Tax=Melia azedarach TaxID=155640 RepID=A0ACC1YG98_MELAZ|nr:putative Cytochrome P450 [Melia azedarach]
MLSMEYFQTIWCPHVLCLRLAPILVVSSAKKAKEIMKTHDLQFSSRPAFLGQQTLSYKCSDLDFAPYNDYWREMRKLCTVQLFSSNKVQQFRSIREDGSFRMIERVSKLAIVSKPVNLSEMMMSLTSTITCRLVFDKRYEDEATVIWAMTYLMKNPRMMKKAQEQIRQLFRNKGFVDEDEVQRLEYLKAVVKETMRLQPALPRLVPRESTEKCTIDRYVIPPKTIVYVNAWATGRDPEALG